MRRVGDAAWRWFESHTDAAKAFGVSQVDVSTLVKKPSKARLRETFEVRPARGPPPRKRKRPTVPRKRAKPEILRVEGAYQNQNGKWRSHMFPGREFDDLDAYRAAKKQRATRKKEHNARNGIHR